MRARTMLVVWAVAAALGGCAGSSGTAPVSDASKGIPDTAIAGKDADTGRISNPGSGGETLREGTGAQDTAAASLKLSVFYEFDQYDVQEQYRPLVEAHAGWLRSHPGSRMMIIGNTDERGTSEYNLALGQRRAESVARMLRVLGVSEAQVEAVSYGKEKPRAAGHDEAAWAQNRRSDFSRP